jgi:phosphoribosylformylglycinamidine synthase
MVGLIEDISYVTTSYFKNEGDMIALVGTPNEQKENYIDGLGGSEYVKLIHNKVTGDAPNINIKAEKDLIKGILELTRGKYINSAHDISDGGLAVSLAESCLINRTLPIGCVVNINSSKRKDFVFFNESQSWILISYNQEKEPQIKKICEINDIIFAKIGITGGSSVKINNDINITLENAYDAYYNSISKIMED